MRKIYHSHANKGLSLSVATLLRYQAKKVDFFGVFPVLTVAISSMSKVPF